MGTSPETMAQVKNILRKLDQSIDAARDRRLSTRTKPGAPVPATPSGPSVAPASNGTPVNRARPMAPKPGPTSFPPQARTA